MYREKVDHRESGDAEKIENSGGTLRKLAED